MVYEFFFTGGLDSTYRLCQLAREEGNVVQPVYIVFDDKGGRYNRPELRRELEAQDKILGYVSANPNTKAEILPIRRISWDKIPYDKQIMDSEEALAGYNFAWQYIFIALYAKWHPGVELCQETLSDSLGIKFREADGRRWIDTTDLDGTLVLAFQNVTWPIMDTPRPVMRERIDGWGYDGVWEHLWFCYKSVNGKPCGVCDNCYRKIMQGMTFLFDKEALHRYRVLKALEKNFSESTNQLYVYYVCAEDKDRFLRDCRVDIRTYDYVLKRVNLFRSLEKMSNKQLLQIEKDGRVQSGYFSADGYYFAKRKGVRKRGGTKR